MTQPTLERFLDDVKHHELTIHQNNGVDRHLTLEKSGGCYHSFKITTFPHYLVITGNMGALIFSQSHYEYIWLCYAIVWGIKKFDELNKE